MLSPSPIPPPFYSPPLSTRQHLNSAPPSAPVLRLCSRVRMLPLCPTNHHPHSAITRSEQPLTLGRWHTIKVSRTARLAVLKVSSLTHTQLTLTPANRQIPTTTQREQSRVRRRGGSRRHDANARIVCVNRINVHSSINARPRQVQRTKEIESACR